LAYAVSRKVDRTFGLMDFDVQQMLFD